jgi:hypothetical protein
MTSTRCGLKNQAIQKSNRNDSALYDFEHLLSASGVGAARDRLGLMALKSPLIAQNSDIVAGLSAFGQARR